MTWRLRHRYEVIPIYGILCLQYKEAPRMASVQFSDVQARPTEFLDLTSLTLDEFQQLVPPFEAAFQAHMAMWRLDGKPRTARQFAVYKNCPLPTPEDRLFFLLTYLKTYALQVVQGRLFGMGQSKARPRSRRRPLSVTQHDPTTSRNHARMPHCLRWGGMASLLGGLGDRFPQHNRELPSKSPAACGGDLYLLASHGI